MKERLRAASRELLISAIGFTNAEVYTDLGALLCRAGEVPMTNADIERRINPCLIMPEAKSVIVCLLSYLTDTADGIISRYARGLDYHTVMRDKLGALADILHTEGFKAECFSDSGDLNERYLARRAGLGFYGRNGFLINPRFGTYTFIGYILTDCPIEPDKPLENTCTGCDRCIKACPGGALVGDGRVIYERCVSYITQKKGELTAEEAELIKRCGSVWGCDVCQEVCPHNINAERSNIPEFTSGLTADFHPNPDMSNREFRRVYRDKAFAWCGKGVLERNLSIIEGDEK